MEFTNKQIAEYQKQKERQEFNEDVKYMQQKAD